MNHQICKCGHHVEHHDVSEAHQCNHCSCQLIEEVPTAESDRPTPGNDQEAAKALGQAEGLPTGSSDRPTPASNEIPPSIGMVLFKFGAAIRAVCGKEQGEKLIDLLDPLEAELAAAVQAEKRRVLESLPVTGIIGPNGIRRDYVRIEAIHELLYGEQPTRIVNTDRGETGYLQTPDVNEQEELGGK